MITELWRRLIHGFDRRRFERELEEEIQLHVELRAAKLRQTGLSRQESEYMARQKFGNTLLLKEASREMWRWNSLETLAQDLRYALRQFRKNAAFTAIAIATLALGIGANTAVFTVINGVILRPLPYPDPERLVSLSETSERFGRWAFSYLNFLDCQRESRSFQGLAASRNEGANLTAPGEPQFVNTRQISAGFLSILGVKPERGRAFLQEEDRYGAAPVALIGHALWQERFGGSTDAIGTKLTLNGKLYTVVGILPPGFQYFRRTQIFTPIGQNNDISMRQREFHPGIQVIARLKENITVDQARTELGLIGRRLADQYPKANAGRTLAAEPLKKEMIGDAGSTLLILVGAVGLVLLIACANVANILLARSISRKREFAIRAALGAGRGRVVQQLLTESVLLSFLGGLAGLLIAFFGTRMALDLLPNNLPRSDEIAPDLGVLLFALAASLVTGLVFGLAPALHQRSELEGTLRQGQRSTARGLQRLQSCLVVAEVALALVLLMGAGLMLRSIHQLWLVNPGFDPHGVVCMSVGLSPKVVNDPALIRPAWRQILENVRAVPGVQSASVNSLVPLRGDNSEIQYWTGSTAPPANNVPMAIVYTPTPDYLQTMKIPLLRGRFFTEQDRLGTEPVVVIDEVLAARAFHGRDPVGSKLTLQFLGAARIVGIVGHVKHSHLDENPQGREELYVPFGQIPDPFMRLTATGLELLVRTSVNPMSIAPAVRQGILGPGRDQPVRNLQTLDEMIGDSMARRRLMLILLGVFATVALLLASIGIYAVISYSINQRIQEMGIRIALGAQPGEVRRLVVLQGMSVALVGIGMGVGLSLVMMQLIKKLLYGVGPTDPRTLAAVVLTLAFVAFVASSIPARRASHVDPMVALRYE